MAYQVLIKRSAEKELDALPAKLRNRIAERLLTLEENPRPMNRAKMLTLNFSKWEEFRYFVDRDSAVGAYYWRGQRNPEWPLASSFERVILAQFGGDKKGASKIYPYDNRYLTKDGQKMWAPGHIQNLRDQYLNMFVRLSSGLRGPNPKDLSPEQWWALGRHHGLITPLLDWSESPYIALYFALADFLTHKDNSEETDSIGSQIGVYRLATGPVVYNETSVVNLEGNGLRIVDVMLDELGSLQGQKAHFTWLDSEEFFELQGFLDNNGKGDLLVQIVLSQDAFSHAYYDLNAHGIDYRLLFPDLRGAALAANTLFHIAIDPNFPA